MRFWDASGTVLGRLERDVSGTPLARLWDVSGMFLGRFWDASGTRLKQPFVAGRKGDRLDENRGFCTDGAQQWGTHTNPMRVRNLAELSKYIGPGAIFYK